MYFNDFAAFNRFTDKRAEAADLLSLAAILVNVIAASLNEFSSL